MQLANSCFKVDKPNGKAMIEGFIKDGQKYRQSIWLAVRDGDFPSLLTLQRAATRFQVSSIGYAMSADDFALPMKYGVFLDCEYFVRNEMALWQTVCSNGLFDIWLPDQPYLRFSNAKSNPSKFRIQLLRVYEISPEVRAQDIKHASDRIDQLVNSLEVNIVRPVIPDHLFDQLKVLLEESVSQYLTKLPQSSETNITKASINIQTVINQDIDDRIVEDEFFEGEKHPRLSSYYERNPKLRAAALNYHGTICKICGFDFRKTYGTRGEGYIEIHHLIPVSSFTIATPVDPKQDMIAVCSNCHRINLLPTFSSE